MYNTCRGWLFIFASSYTVITVHKHESVPLFGRPPFCVGGIKLLSSNHFNNVWLSMCVYSLYSTLNKVIGRSASGDGWDPGLGMSEVMPVFHIAGYVLLL